MPLNSGVNLTKIMGEGRAETEGLVGGTRRGVWGGIPFPTGKESGERAKSASQKKNHFFWLEIACFGAFWAVFLSVSSPKMLSFPPGVVIWWTLKMYFWEIVNTLLKSWSY